MRMKAKYFRDYYHNYLILDSINEEETEENYQLRMLSSGKIERLLKCSVRNVNGTAYLYYDISSKVSLENLYQGKKMSYEQVRDLLGQIDRIYQTLGQFFMQENSLLLQPEYLYYDITSKKYFGLYYPEGGSDFENPYESLMDFLLNHVDTGNQKLTELVYRIYEMSEESYFSIADALTFFEDIEEESLKADAVIESNYAKENNIVDIENAFENEVSNLQRNDSEEKEENQLISRPQIEQGRSRLFYGVFALLSLCGMGAVVGIYFMFRLTQKELMIIVCCGAVMGLCFLFSLIQFLLSRKKIRRQEKEEQELLWDIEDEFREERQIALGEVLDKSMAGRTGGNDFSNNSFRGQNTEGYISGKMSEKDSRQYGETIFVDVQKQSREYKLYALDKKNKKHIELTQFPYTIGKMAGCVDCVLSDDSISRLHARFEKQDGKILLTDMNSRNGTFKNGLRMEPSETVEIEPGDEIRFGNLNYCYR